MFLPSGSGVPAIQPFAPGLATTPEVAFDLLRLGTSGATTWSVQFMRLVGLHPPKPVPASTHVEPIDATYPNRRIFLEQAQIGADACRFFWRCAPSVASGARVLVRIRYAGESACFEVAGTVVQAREDLRGPARSGLVIEVRDAGLFEFARAYASARGNPVQFGRRAEERAAVDLPAKLHLGDRAYPVRVRDLSRGGAFVEASGANVLRGAFVQLTIRLGLFRQFEAAARVAWQGRRGQRQGFGVEFLELSERSRTLLLRALSA
jgi:hypothetical protein